MKFLKNQSSIFSYQLLNYLMAGFLFSVFFSNSSFAQSVRFTTFDDRPICEDSNGVWREYGDSCLDWCYPKFNKFSFCSRKVEFGCDCGEDKCWNGDSCVTISDYAKIYKEKKAQEDELLAEARAKREKEFKENQQIILERLVSEGLSTTQGGGQDEKGNEIPVNNNLAEFYKDFQPSSSIPQISVNSAPNIKSPTPQLKPIEIKPVEKLEIPISNMPKIPPLFLQKEKAKKEAEAKKLEELKKDDEKNEELLKNGEGPLGLPVIPLPQ